MRRVAIIGIGATQARPKTPNLSYKELTYAAAKLAYADAGIKHSEIESFVTLAEDINEGTSIFDEYTPDQLGGAQKPMHTITHDGLVGIADGVMQIASGLFDIVAVEAHSKASNIKNIHNTQAYALDPNWVRPLGLPARAIGALEAAYYWQKNACAEAQRSQAQWHIIAKNRDHAKRNPWAAYPATVRKKEYERSPSRQTPLKEIEIAQHADGACVIILAGEEKVRTNGRQPIWVQGIGWASETSEIGSRSWGQAAYGAKAAQQAYKMAGVTNPGSQIDFFEIDDTYAFKELQHLEAIGLYEPQTAWKKTLECETEAIGKHPVNLSGGCLGLGETLEAKGLYQITELVKQLRGEAGGRQLERAERGLALSWRGVPTSSGACVIVGVN